jgi:hypothetical protein
MPSSPALLSKNVKDDISDEKLHDPRPLFNSKSGDDVGNEQTLARPVAMTEISPNEIANVTPLSVPSALGADIAMRDSGSGKEERSSSAPSSPLTPIHSQVIASSIGTEGVRDRDQKTVTTSSSSPHFITRAGLGSSGPIPTLSARLHTSKVFTSSSSLFPSASTSSSLSNSNLSHTNTAKTITSSSSPSSHSSSSESPSIPTASSVALVAVPPPGEIIETTHQQEAKSYSLHEASYLLLFSFLSRCLHFVLFVPFFVYILFFGGVFVIRVLIHI